MSVQSEITRIQTARNTLRTKAVDLGIGLSTDNLSQLATKYDAIVNRGAISGEVSEGNSYPIPAGYHNGSGVVVGVGGGVTPRLQAKTATPTKNQQSITPDTGYYGLSAVTVAPIPDAYQDVTDVDAAAGDVLAGKKIVTSTGVLTTGTMPNNGAVSQTLSTATTSYSVPAGYHNGSGTVSITLETKTATPNNTTQQITPSTGKVLSQVTVSPVPAKYGDATNKTATSADILSGKTAIGWDSGNSEAIALTGTMANNGAVSGTITGLGSVPGDTSFTIPAGYTSGGTVSLSSDIETALAAI